MIRARGECQRLVLIAVFLGSALAWAGCGDDGGGSKPTPTPTSTATPVPTAAAGAGLMSEILSASVASDPAGQISVVFTLTDGSGVPLTPTLSSAQNPQQARVRFTIAQLEQYSGGGELGNTFYRYVNDIDATSPSYDSGGTLSVVDAATGTYRYTFNTMLPEDYDPTLTYTVGAQVDRTFAGVQEGVNPVFDFVPAGGTPFVWEDVTTDECNTCHQPLIQHGNRREVRLCKLCHTEAATDPKGTSIDFRVMIHMIHAGKDLPSVVDGPPGSFYGIYSGFSMSYAIFSEKLADGSVIGVGFPRYLEECLTCHAEGPTADFYREKPSAEACATCHDDVNPSLQTTAAGPPGTNHPPGGYADGQCGACHAAIEQQEFDISVPGAHTVPDRSTQLQGLNVAIVALASHNAGQTPTISFTVTNDAGEPYRDLSVLNRLAFAYSGPTTDYTAVFTPTAVGGGAAGTLVGPDGQGLFQYTPATGIPADATGTWAIGAEARREVELTSTVVAEEAAVNPVVTFTVDDSPGMPHRTIVENMNCARCHGDFSKDFPIHGNLRNQIQYCEICHNATQSDAARRKNDPMAVAAGEDNASINFRVMIHKIHTGEDLEQQPYIIYGFGPPPQNYSKNDFGEVRYPGDRRLCDTCHVEDSQLIPPYPSTALPTLRTKLDPANGEVIPADPPEVQPITSVCTSCHDSDAALAHAATNTTDGIVPTADLTTDESASLLVFPKVISDGTRDTVVEACPVCHAEGAAFAVSTVHFVAPSNR
jgi:OmcA/MtrC family decaheme c-type cytochrome